LPPLLDFEEDENSGCDFATTTETTAQPPPPTTEDSIESGGENSQLPSPVHRNVIPPLGSKISSSSSSPQVVPSSVSGFGDLVPPPLGSVAQSGRSPSLRKCNSILHTICLGILCCECCEKKLQRANSWNIWVFGSSGFADVEHSRRNAEQEDPAHVATSSTTESKCEESIRWKKRSSNRFARILQSSLSYNNLSTVVSFATMVFLIGTFGALTATNDEGAHSSFKFTPFHHNGYVGYEIGFGEL
jgi:hypothetical protein